MFEKLKSIFGYTRLEIEDVEKLLIRIGDLATKARILRKSNELQNILIDEESTKNSTNTLTTKDIFNKNIAILTFDPDNFPKRINKKIDKLFLKITKSQVLTKRDLRKFYKLSTYVITPLQKYQVLYDFNVNPDKIIIL